LPAHYVPPSGFGYPLDGLLPSVPGRFCFTPAALLGFTLRSLTFQQVSSRFRLEEPTYRSACRCSHRRSVGPARQAAVPGLCPCRKFRPTASGFSTAAAGSSLGVHPSRACHEGLDRAFTRSPLTRFADRITNDPSSRRPRVSINLRLDPPLPPGRPSNGRRTTLLGFPHLPDPGHSSAFPPGL
jgi:hypothetical protein